MEAETGYSWIPGLALLARNDENDTLVIPAKAGIQGMRHGVGFVSEQQHRKQRSNLCFFRRKINGDQRYQACVWD